MNIKKKAVGLLFISITLMGFDFKGCGGINGIMEEILKQKTPKREKHKIDLAEIIKSERISSIFIRKNEAPLENQIKDRLKELCPNLDISQIRVYERDFRDNTVIIYAGQESSYSGFVTIRYTLSNLSDKSHLIDLSKIIKIKEIDCINDNQTSIKHQAADQLKKLYPELDMSQIDVQSYVVMPGSMDEGRTGVMVSPKIVPKIVMFDKGDYATIESCYTGEVDLWCRYLSKQEISIKMFKEGATLDQIVDYTGLSRQEIATEILQTDTSPDEVMGFTHLHKEEMAVAMFKAGKSIDDVTDFTGLHKKEIIIEILKTGTYLDDITDFTGLYKKEIVQSLLGNKKIKKDEDCVICYELLLNSDLSFLCSCGHILHKQCFKELVAEAKKQEEEQAYEVELVEVEGIPLWAPVHTPILKPKCPICRAESGIRITIEHSEINMVLSQNFE